MDDQDIGEGASQDNSEIELQEQERETEADRLLNEWISAIEAVIERRLKPVEEFDRVVNGRRYFVNKQEDSLRVTSVADISVADLSELRQRVNTEDALIARKSPRLNPWIEGKPEGVQVQDGNKNSQQAIKDVEQVLAQFKSGTPTTTNSS